MCRYGLPRSFTSVEEVEYEEGKTLRNHKSEAASPAGVMMGRCLARNRKVWAAELGWLMDKVHKVSRPQGVYMCT